MIRTFDDIHLLAQAIEELTHGKSKLFVLADENTMAFCWPELVSACPLLNDAHMLEIDPGEDNKCLEIAGQLWSCLLETQADRNTLLINLGGGVVTDMGGYVASCYKRGIDYINIPTTLMAQTDAALGGKTGINHEGVKNAVGSFYPAVAVLNYSGFLRTLPDEELLSGMAEMLKHALIADKGLWDDLKVSPPTSLFERPDLIAKSISVKRHITSEDPAENGIRKLLNCGHTIGHALESRSLKTDNPVSHGRAVAMGLAMESRLAMDKQILTPTEFSEIKNFIEGIYGSIVIPESAVEELILLMRNDKKNRDGQFLFALPTSIGSAAFDIKITEKEILTCLYAFGKKSGA